jgi:hypothetical protein
MYTEPRRRFIRPETKRRDIIKAETGSLAQRLEEGL